MRFLLNKGSRHRLPNFSLILSLHIKTFTIKLDASFINEGEKIMQLSRCGLHDHIFYAVPSQEHLEKRGGMLCILT